MIEDWLIELVKGFGKVFLNPLLYWAILLVIIVGSIRVQRERKEFGSKVFDVFSEWKDTWVISIVLGLLISLITLGTGMVFSYEVIMLLSVVLIIFSLGFKLTFLSASYTIGITYLLILFSPLLLESQSYVAVDLFKGINFTSITILLGLFLIVEAILIGRTKRNETFPALSLSSRGAWIGQQHIKKLSVIPFFVLVPSGLITPFAPYWPYFTIGDESYGLLLVPFIIGFDHIVRGMLPQKAARKLAKSISLLGLIVIIISIGSIYYSWLSVIVVFIAIFGRELINYRHRINDKANYFSELESGLRILAIIPGTPADRLDILVGETVTRVNGQKINSVNEFYRALQLHTASFKLDVIDDANEVRFIQSALYQGDHHELGIIFTEKPNYLKMVK